MNAQVRRVRHNQRILRSYLSPAAALLHHVAALAQHNAAASAFSVRHRLIRHADHHRRCRDQQQDGNETGQATHTTSIALRLEELFETCKAKM